jgi:MoxR-like ATPase
MKAELLRPTTHMEILWERPEDLLPTPDANYVDVHGVLEDALKLAVPARWLDESDPTAKKKSILFTGNSGVAKTLLAAHLAKAMGEKIADNTSKRRFPFIHKHRCVPVVTIDCHQNMRRWELEGGPLPLSDGSACFVPGQFPTAIKIANDVGVCVLLADEINALRSEAQVMFNKVADWRSGLTIPLIGRCKLEQGCRIVVVGTLNPAVFGGSHNLNLDLCDRFREFKIGYPDMQQEQEILEDACPWADSGLIEKSVALANITRNNRDMEYKISTRYLVGFLNEIRDMDGELEGPLQGIANKYYGKDLELMRDRIKGTFNVKISDTKH